MPVITIGSADRVDDFETFTSRWFVDALFDDSIDGLKAVSSRKIGYEEWRSFIIITGLKDHFGDKRFPKTIISKLTANDLVVIKVATANWLEKFNDGRPAGTGLGEDSTLERLNWLCHWFDYALKQDHPAIEFVD